MKDRRKRTRNKTADYMRPMSACFHAGGLRGGRPERLGSRWRGLLDSIETKQGACALDRNSQKAALAGFSKRASDGTPEGGRRGVLLGRLGSRVHEAATIFSRLLTRLSETELELRCGRAQRCKNSSGAPDTTGHATLSMSSRTSSRGRARTTRGSFAHHWKHLFEDSPLSDVTPHVLRHSFASIANDLGFTEVTSAALVGHAKGSVTSKYIHTLDTALIMAAGTISGYVQGLLDGDPY
jgi:Phage integrase family